MTVPCSSLDGPISADDGSGRPRGDVLSADPDLRPDVLVETDELGRIVRQNVGTFAATLPNRNQEILRDRLFTDEPAPKVQLAVRFGVTRERVRQIEEDLKKQLRRRLSAQLGDALDGRSISRGRVVGRPRATRRLEGGANPARQARRLLEEIPA
jgi:DNA-directed RNA polymerase sigma subunit (sigma70/sigma32)